MNFSPVSEMLIDLTGNRNAARYFWLFNQSQDAPYHNATHVDYMLQDLADLMKYTPDKLAGQLPALVTAVLFHDFNHSAGKEFDSWNIQQALWSLDCFRALGFETSSLVKILIAGTQYPYLPIESSVASDYVHVIRDLDLMTIFHIDSHYSGASLQYSGLLGEMRVKNPKLTRDDFIAGNEEFLRKSEFYTEYGQAKQKRDLERCMSILRTDLTQLLSNIPDEAV